jgi:5'(3')-deoxyribonucleotidase
MPTNMTEIEPWALFDMDGTLSDFEKALSKELNFLKSPDEPEFYGHLSDDAPGYIRARADLIRADGSWWENLERFPLGWDVLKIAQDLKYNIMILTQGPRRNPEAWAGKKRWIDKHLGPNTNLTITRNKGLVYGKVLVDDFPEYVEQWLSWRERGLVIMPANDSNIGYEHPQVIRYDGSNLEKVKRAMTLARNRKAREEVDYTSV